MTSWWPEVEGCDFCSSLYMQRHFNYLSDYAENLNLITFVVFLFRVTENWKSPPCEKMDTTGLRAVVQYLRPQQLYEDQWVTLAEGANSYSMMKSTYTLQLLQGGKLLYLLTR